jgi:hypothetical protein
MNTRLAFVLFAGVLLVACGGSVASTGGGGGGGATVGVTAPAVKSANGGYQADTSVPAPPVTGEGPKVIRTGRVTLEVANGKYQSTVDSLTDTMLGYGGYVSASDGAAESGSLRAGTITFQVPADKFQAALDAARKLGKVQGYVVNSQDVSTQYVDLQARLANLEATHDAMVKFFADAKTVQDDIAIQNQLAQITQQIEQLKGQIDYLDHATAYSSVTVSLHEAAAAVTPSEQWGFLPSLAKAAHNFVDTLDWLIVGLGSILPVLLLLVPVYLGVRFRRRLARIFAV